MGRERGPSPAARLASESGPVWDDSSHTTQTNTHTFMTAGEFTAHTTMFTGFTKQYTSVDNAD